MFHPNFKFTNKMINNIADISAAREIIMNAPLLPKWDVQLRKEAILKMAHHSTSIEGNRLTLEDVGKILGGKDIRVWEKDRKEVEGYLKVLEYIDKIGQKGLTGYTEENILRIHRYTTHGLLPDARSGHYRDIQVAVVDAVGKVIFQPPKTAEVPSLMREFVSWLNSEDTGELYPVLMSGIAHYELVRIHPFVDGNGRTARALATLILYLRGFDTKRFFALDDYYNEDRNRYYDALETVDPKTNDLTQWLEYFTEGVAVSMGRVKQTVLELSMDKHIKERKGQVYLTDRQRAVVKYLQTNPRITVSEVQRILKITRETANQDLKQLIKLGLVKKKGKSVATYYILA